MDRDRVFVSAEGEIDEAVKFPYLSDFLTMCIKKDYLTWKRSEGPVYVFRAKEDKWVMTFARLSWGGGPIDSKYFQKAIDFILEQLSRD